MQKNLQSPNLKIIEKVIKEKGGEKMIYINQNFIKKRSATKTAIVDLRQWIKNKTEHTRRGRLVS